ncbi:hypothetical protein EBZ39_12440, partial [bacterium]|nr:hypothetical protein [bacterium]
MKKVVVTAALAALVLGAPAQAFTWKSLLFGSPDSVGLALDTSKGHLEAIMARCSKRNLTIAAAVTVVAAGAYWWWTKSKKTDASAPREGLVVFPDTRQFNEAVGDASPMRPLVVDASADLTYLSPEPSDNNSSVTDTRLAESRNARPGSTQNSEALNASASSSGSSSDEILPESLLAGRPPLTPDEVPQAPNSESPGSNTNQGVSPIAAALANSPEAGFSDAVSSRPATPTSTTPVADDPDAFKTPERQMPASFQIGVEVLSPENKETPLAEKQRQAGENDYKIKRVIDFMGLDHNDDLIVDVSSFFNKQYEASSSENPFCLQTLADGQLASLAGQLKNTATVVHSEDNR